MEKSEKDLLVIILKVLNDCNERLKEIENQLYVEPTIENYDDIVTPISKEVFDEIVKETGSKLIFMGIA
jgi:archaellum component FlaC|tara:strand:+ start:5045 stop:5251 length:207 start_codon:yes stop_codon:yes gene_type:complete